MGAKAWFIAYFDDDPKATLQDNPELDREASLELAKQLFPNVTLKATDDGDLSFLNPDERELLVGCYPGLRIVAHDDLGGDYPSKIDPLWLDPSLGHNVYLHATHSVVDLFAFGLWREGKLIRSLSVSPDNGVQEQVGDPFPFEIPYWDGKFPVELDDDDRTYPLPFHPLDLSEASMLHHLGFQFEGSFGDWVCDPSEVPIASFELSRHRPRWKFW